MRRTQESDDVTAFAVRDISVTKLQSSPEPTSVSDRSSATDLVNVNFSAVASMGLESKIIMTVFEVLHNSSFPAKSFQDPTRIDIHSMGCGY